MLRTLLCELLGIAAPERLVKVLAIDGGGIRGLIPALEREAERLIAARDAELDRLCTPLTA